MSDTLKILSILLICGVICIVLKRCNPEYSLFVSLAAGIVTALMILGSLSEPMAELKAKIEGYGIETEYFAVALKALGIGYITTFIADSCRDSGQTSLAAKAELAGKAAIFIISLPLLVAVLDIAVGFVT